MARCLGDVMRERAVAEGRVGAPADMPGHLLDNPFTEKWTDRQQARRSTREPGLAAAREAVQEALQRALGGKAPPRPPVAPTARRVILDRPKPPRAPVPSAEAAAARQATWAKKLGYATVEAMVENRRARRRLSAPERNRRYLESLKKDPSAIPVHRAALTQRGTK